MPELAQSYTSTGEKLFAHQEAMQKLRDGRGQPIVAHILPTDTCQHTCAFCSVQTRAGDVLRMAEMDGYLRILTGYGLRAVIISGGGNPILYRCPDTGARFDQLVAMVRGFGLDVGLITNGMPTTRDALGRRVWRNVSGATLDELTWVRISMAGLDHKEKCVYVPEIDPLRTALGFSYVYHDLYECPEEPNHGKVSTTADLLRFANVSAAEARTRMVSGEERLPWLTEQIAGYVEEYRPRYVRLLPNCLEPNLIAERCAQLRSMADSIDPSVVFVQYKPPQAPRACFLGYVHPVLNSDGYVYPCDSVVLNTEVREPGEHDFGSAWRMCHWSEIGGLYERPVRSLIANPSQQCPGCVFGRSNELLDAIVSGEQPIGAVPGNLEHANFV